jgi:hypothetical protein
MEYNPFDTLMGNVWRDPEAEALLPATPAKVRVQVGERLEMLNHRQT